MVVMMCIHSYQDQSSLATLFMNWLVVVFTSAKILSWLILSLITTLWNYSVIDCHVQEVV